MGFALTPTNLIQFFGTISPLLISFLLLSASVLNRNIKGLIFMAGIVFAFIINTIVKNILRVPHDSMRSMACSLVDLPLSESFSVPSWNSVFIAFTLMYMFLPMFFMGNMNYGIIVSLGVMFSLDAMSKMGNKCTNPLGIVAGALLGLVLGGLWYAIIRLSGNPQLLYFEELSGRDTCTKPSKQKFKCSVYKNGELIKNL